MLHIISNLQKYEISINSHSYTPFFYFLAHISCAYAPQREQKTINNKKDIGIINTDDTYISILNFSYFTRV